MMMRRRMRRQRGYGFGSASDDAATVLNAIGSNVKGVIGSVGQTQADAYSSVISKAVWSVTLAVIAGYLTYRLVQE